jgi:hypothetical protein
VEEGSNQGKWGAGRARKEGFGEAEEGEGREEVGDVGNGYGDDALEAGIVRDSSFMGNLSGVRRDIEHLLQFPIVNWRYSITYQP